MPAVADDITTTTTVGPSYGLHLNISKCEVISNTAVSHAVFDGFKQINTDSATLLGAPLSTGAAMMACLADHYTDLTRPVERLKFISAHDTLVLLKNSLSALKLLHILCAACCVGHESLRKFDDQMRLAVCNICNVCLTDDQWLQASLLVCNAGLGLRRVSSLASSALLASAAGICQLEDQILHHVSQAMRYRKSPNKCPRRLFVQ